MKRKYRMLEHLYIEGRATWFQIAGKILESRRDLAKSKIIKTFYSQGAPTEPF